MDSLVAVRRVTGYHGTHQDVADAILNGQFVLSRNSWDWLGDGLYFFEDGCARAWDWARKRHKGQVAVIGATIRLEDCLNLHDIGALELMVQTYDSYLTRLKLAGEPLPVQTDGNHRLDREVLNYLVGVLQEQGVIVRSIRASFREGSPVYPGSALYRLSHIQVAVRDVDVIGKTWLATEEARQW